MLKNFIKITAFIGMLSYLGLAQAADLELFSDAWMKGFMKAWNNTAEITTPLAEIDFNSKIAYGFKDDEKPKGILIVEKGKVTSAGAYNGEELNWDLRATQENWEKWIKAGSVPKWRMGTSLAFKKGDYWKMLKTPKMWGPFLKSFGVMGAIK